MKDKPSFSMPNQRALIYANTATNPSSKCRKHAYNGFMAGWTECEVAKNTYVMNNARAIADRQESPMVRDGLIKFAMAILNGDKTMQDFT